MFVEQEVFVSEIFDRIVKDFDYSHPGIYDISESGIEIECFDFQTGEKKFSLLRNLIVKEPVEFYYQIGDLKATSGHLIYSDIDREFIRADQHPEAKRVDEKIYVVDFTVDETHNYFANGQLNHNTSPGGKALKHACSLMINMAPILAADAKILDEAKEQIGHRVRAKIQKNKTGRPFRQAEYNIIYTQGIVERESELLDVGLSTGTVTRPTPRSLEIDDIKFSTREAALAYLKDEPVFNRILLSSRDRYINGDVVMPSTNSKDDEADDANPLFEGIE